jgi:hypothetical protein
MMLINKVEDMYKQSVANCCSLCGDDVWQCNAHVAVYVGPQLVPVT